MTDEKPPRIVYAKPPRTARRKAPPARVTIPAVIVTARKPSKVDAAIRCARMLKKQETEEPQRASSSLPRGISADHKESPRRGAVGLLKFTVRQECS